MQLLRLPPPCAPSLTTGMGIFARGWEWTEEEKAIDERVVPGGRKKMSSGHHERFRDKGPEDSVMGCRLDYIGQQLANRTEINFAGGT